MITDMTTNPSPSSGDHDHDAFQRDLERAASGDRDARDRLWANHYELLRSCARTWFDKNWGQQDRGAGISIGGTHIVNAAYERLHDRTAVLGKGRAFFFQCFYTECMRIAVEHYRKTKKDKGRGKLGQRQNLNTQLLRDKGIEADVDAIYDILAELEEQDHAAGLIAMLKVFENRPDENKSGAMRSLYNQEVADLLEMKLRTVEEHWRFAKAFLVTRLGDDS